MTGTRLFSALRWTLIGAIVLVLLLAVGRQVTVDPIIAMLAAILILALGVTAAEPVAVPLLSMPLLLVTARVGASGVDLTVSDAVLAIALGPAILVALGGISPLMRRALWVVVAYQLATLFTVVNNPYTANVVEWFHAGTLVGGGLIVGWAVGRRGLAGPGLTLLLLSGLGLALAALTQAALQYSAGDFGPVYLAWPYATHKNAIGTVFALLAVVAYIHPHWMRWTRGWALAAFWTFALALATTQSRQAIIGLGAAIFVIVMRGSKDRRRSKSILLAIVPALVGVSVMVQDQVKSGNQFNSIFQRVTWFEDSIGIWSTDPWVGVGLRWWYTDRFNQRFQPPNAEIENLTSSGVIGLAGFLFLMIGTWLIARRLGPVYGSIAELVLLARFVQSQFDLFWVAVQASLPFILLGICLGAAALHDDRERGSRAAEHLRDSTTPAEAAA